MASLIRTKFQLKFSELKAIIYEVPSFVCNMCFTLYCRLYKSVNTLFIVETIFAFYYSMMMFIFGGSYKLEWKTHWQSPVCRDILRRKYYLTKSKSAFSWALCSAGLTLLLGFEMMTCSILGHFNSYADIVWFTELCIVILLGFNSVMAFGLYLWSVFSKPMVISPIQRKLFRINDNEPGFISKTTDESTVIPKQERLPFSSWRESSDTMPSSFMCVTPLDYSAKSWASSSPSLDTTSSSWSFHRMSPFKQFSSTPKSCSKSNFLPGKLSFSELQHSPLEKQITNKKELESFLKEYDEEEKKHKSMLLEESKSFLSNVSAIDNNPMLVLRKCIYQRACRQPNSEATENDSTEIHCGDNVWLKLKVSDKMLTVWSEKLRKWLCQTILVKLVQEIEDINNTLSQMGLPEFQIGSVSLFVLHQIAITKLQHIPTLPLILPYLDMHLNQEYLVRRLKSLARGGCMGDFKWNSGGSYDDKQWCDDLPTDSAIVMHIFSCYLDAHLPPEPHCPDGKPFTSKYFKKVPEKPISTKGLYYIYQSSINPPHYKVVVDEDIYTLPKGRNNLFCAMLVFLHYLKVKECGMLGRVNLGQSGLNILWVIEW